MNPMGLVDMGVNIISVRDSGKQHHHSLEAGERPGTALLKNGHGDSLKLVISVGFCIHIHSILEDNSVLRTFISGNSAPPVPTL